MTKRKWVDSDRPYGSQFYKKGECTGRVMPDSSPGTAGIRWSVFRAGSGLVADGSSRKKTTAKKNAERAMARCVRK